MIFPKAVLRTIFHSRTSQAYTTVSEEIFGKAELSCACQGEGESKFERPNKHGTGFAPRLSALFNQIALKNMLTRLPRTVAFTTRRAMATYRKVREPYDLKKKPRVGLKTPSHLQTKPRQYAPIDSTTSFGLRAPEKEPWKPDDDRFDTPMAREVDKPIGGALRQHLVVRPSRKDGDATSATPDAHSQGECNHFAGFHSNAFFSGNSPIQETIAPSPFLIVRRTTATIQDMHRALHGWGPLEIHEGEHI